VGLRADLLHAGAAAFSASVRCANSSYVAGLPGKCRRCARRAHRRRRRQDMRASVHRWAGPCGGLGDQTRLFKLGCARMQCSSQQQMDATATHAVFVGGAGKCTRGQIASGSCWRVTLGAAEQRGRAGLQWNSRPGAAVYRWRCCGERQVCLGERLVCLSSVGWPRLARGLSQLG
jgi:hypothetical protein